MQLRLPSRLGLVVACIAGIAGAQYTIQDTFDHTNFFQEFNFFAGNDPTHGYVSFANAQAANQSALAGYSNNAVYLGVDYTTMNPSGGRGAVRLTSNNAYTHGLFIADIAHMPAGICGVWPAFWTFGPNWPSSGEIDIIEGVNGQSNNQVTLHTSAGCTISNAGAAPSTSLANPDCNSGNADNGCGQITNNAQSFGTGFNSNQGGGGVYAMEWTSTSISVYFFPRAAIPADILSGQPNPASWGAPQARFSGDGCNIDQHFNNHNIVFDTTFCGDWAGNVWGGSACAAKAPTCQQYVANNPQDFQQAYWLINSVKVYKQPGQNKRGLIPTPFLA